MNYKILKFRCIDPASRQFNKKVIVEEDNKCHWEDQKPSRWDSTVSQIIEKLGIFQEIYSVQRLRDNSIYTIYDRVPYCKDHHPILGHDYESLSIQKIEFINNDIILKGHSNSIRLINAPNAIKTHAEPIKVENKIYIQKQNKTTSTMKVVIKSKKEQAKPIGPGCLVYNKKSGYHAIIAKNNGVGNTVKLLIINVDNPSDHTTIEAFKYLDANKLDLELFEGTITLENEK